jgi:hypothetical protein
MPRWQLVADHGKEGFGGRVETGEQPRLFGIEPPRRRVGAVRIVDMTSSNSWASSQACFGTPRKPFWNMRNLRLS